MQGTEEALWGSLAQLDFYVDNPGFDKAHSLMIFIFQKYRYAIGFEFIVFFSVECICY